MRLSLPIKPARLIVASALLAAAGFLTAGSAHAQALTWTLPAGGETWTAGTSHTVIWTGGLPTWTVNVEVIDMNTFTAAGSVAAGVANTGQVVWNIPPSLPPGSYALYIEETALTTWTYGPTFTVQAGPNCGAACYSTGTSSPSVVCGATAADAASLAQAAALSALGTSCNAGSTLDPSSVIVDVTFLSFGAFACPAGYSGAYAYEASAVGCCCPTALPILQSTWGRVKTLFR